MAFYKAVGKFLDGSGGEIALVNAEVLAQETGTHYNRCRRLYVLLSAAMQILHFEAFIDEAAISIDDLQADIELFEINGADADLPASLASIISRYAAYNSGTLSICRGPTAAYWMRYVEMIDLRNDFSRSIRCGDFNLYLNSLNQLAAYFFALNHPKYARLIFALLKNRIKVWLEVGLISKNTLRFIDVNSIYNELGPTLCTALPGFHSFTRCDYTPSFFKKGKINPFKILRSRADYQAIFAELGKDIKIDKLSLDLLENFVCNQTKALNVNVNEARYEIFYKTCKPTSNNIFKNIKSFEKTSPPNKAVLLQQIYRCNYISLVWKNANLMSRMKNNVIHTHL